MKTEMAKTPIIEAQVRYNIKFPPTEPHTLEQNEALFSIVENGEEKFFRFHDYGELFRRPGLYEQLFYERLKCVSPSKVVSLLRSTLQEVKESFSELRVLDFGAGNGIVAEEFRKIGVARIIGIDINEDAFRATERDRPSVYDAYYVKDLTMIEPEDVQEIRNWQCNCLTTVAALGFNDIPPQAFVNAFNLVEKNSWVAFNIKVDFLDEADQTGFSALVKQLIFRDFLELHHLERYRHRISIDGRGLYYYALVGRKKCNI
jgi:SAM-dependent methyltransferase